MRDLTDTAEESLDPASLPFWLTALVLGILAYPRGRELEEFDRPMRPTGEPA